MEELLKRDQKGLYSKALKGEIKDVVGVDISYDTPESNLVIDNTNKENLDSNIDEILLSLKL